ncbi:TonB-dependent receptor [Sphingomonas sp. RP10(2022)]|uniref:TonB-dependent receptor n=1 Tax=Sphingomonas liriopis TaxID=2949094 RepID=A0A9X2HR99_9SPHN|nr:TonB-dependent receptor [Sphingomonas liriopis]MCP3734009.1 TonB-dependent receptor [Sphingomonas liriopis]
MARSVTWFGSTGSIALLAGMFAGPALAQETAPAAPAPAQSTPDDIVVTAQRRSERLQDVPISINAFSSDKINKLDIRSSADLGNVTPNVNIALSQGPGSQPTITVRGIGLNDNNTNNAGPIAIYVDDAYLSSPSSQSFATFDLQRIEVLKGPQGTLYGRNTSGGAINFISARPTEKTEGYLEASYGSFDTVKVEGAIGGRIADDLNGRLSFVKNYSQGYSYNFLTDTHENGANDYALRGQLQYRIAPNLTALLIVSGGQVRTRAAKYGHLGAFDPASLAAGNPTACPVAQVYANRCVDLFGYTQPSFYNGSYNVAGKTRIDNFNAIFRLDYEAGFADLTSITSFQYTKKFVPEDSDSSPRRILEISYGSSNKTVTQELKASHKDGDLQWTAGLYFLHESLRQDQPLGSLLDYDQLFGAGAGDGIANIQTDRSHQLTDAYAAYTQLEYDLTPKLKLIGGGRITHENRSFQYAGMIAYQQGGMDHFGTPVSLLPAGAVIPKLNDSNFSFKLGANYHIRPGVMTYATVTTGFKSGAYNGGFLSVDPIQAAAQVIPVKPETDTAYEIGLKSSFLDNRVTFNIAGFYTDYRNLQTFALVPTANGPVNSLTSARKVHNIGADVELIVRPVEGLTLTSQFGLLNAKIDAFDVKVPGTPSLAGNQLSYSPHFSTFLQADYTFPAGPGAIDLQATGSYKSHQYYDSTNDPYSAQPAYWLVGARAGYTIGRYDIAVFAKNLTKTRYSTYTFNAISPFGFVQPMQGAPRFIGGEVRYKF